MENINLSALTLHEIKNLNKIRLGWDHDGGYIIADGLTYDCIICCGIGTDNSFERGLKAKYPDVPFYMYDPAGQPSAIDNTYFVRAHIGSDNVLSPLFLGHRDLFVKMDIEGAELEWLGSLTPEDIAKIKQFVVEFHDIERCLPFIEMLNRTHYLIHAHPNNYEGTVNIEGKEIPRCIELTFVRKGQCQNVRPNVTLLPLCIDMVNNPYTPDHSINFKPFVNE